MEEMFKTLPQHTCSWLKSMPTLYKYQDVWNTQEFVEGTILAQQNFKADPSDVFLCSLPKSGTTWLKALVFAIITRETFDVSTSPLLTTLPHHCLPNCLELGVERSNENYTNSRFLPIPTHIPYNSLPQSIIASNCKIVYIYRNMKDVLVSYYNFFREKDKIPVEDAPFEVAFDEFCHGISWCGPYWDHVLGYWRASLDRPEVILLLKYEDMKKDPTSNVKRLADFIGYPFTIKEEEEGVIENIIKLCSFENLKSLEVNKSGKLFGDHPDSTENRLFFRKAKDGDWENYFTHQMVEKIDKLIDDKLGATGLVLK
ncbi:hypothetical protein QVD17_25462 [Tagetes erecta]|uniref:Sulfotransferase n=1 Tax=Tagetes erecta TaxID=13708 RepID=A0AAD8KG18_TARER|nr:hypothetical protein QVD17_25462 [Tagetes erecta]